MTPDLDFMVSDRRPRGKKGVSWRPSWSFKGPTVEHLTPILADAPGPVVHACCGPSYLPREDVRVDLEHPSADVLADVCDLDTVLEEAGTVFMDPPYGWHLPTRQRAASAAWRLLAPGGWLITHAPWLPRMPGGDLIRCDFREDPGLNWPLPPVILSIWRKPEGLGLGKTHLAELERRGKVVPARPEASMWTQDDVDNFPPSLGTREELQ